MEYTFVSEPMPYGRFGSKKKTRKNSKRTEDRKKKVSLPKELASKLPGCRREEPALNTPRCRVKVYRRTCPIDECDYLSGRYVSHNNALIALLGHLRWVHGYG